MPETASSGSAARWDPQQYLRFEAERTQPARDLVGRVADLRPSRVIDLGCGTGTSTALLRRQWPGAEITGLDRSPEMVAAARASDPSVRWEEGDIGRWAPPAPYDLVFSNAALHWVPDHAHLFPRLLQRVSPGGALAVQMPVNQDSPAHRSLRAVAARPEWARHWPVDLDRSEVAGPNVYYDALGPGARQVELWQTEYLHVLPDPEAIVEWIKGTTLRPYLTALATPGERDAFLAEILDGIRRDYRPQADGRVLFPFRRLFLVARR